jgi:hypothetical protein
MAPAADEAHAPSMRRSTLRAVAGCTAAASLLLVQAPPAGAARPVKQACVGVTFSTGARGSQPPSDTVGGTIRWFARDRVQSPPGLGDGIQLLQAGLLSDDVEPNVCN